MSTRPATLVALALLLCTQASTAGDEVDYSAPYLTLENGELVTKYPTKAHAGDDAGAETAGTAGGEPPQRRWMVLVPLAAIALGLYLLVRRQRMRE